MGDLSYKNEENVIQNKKTIQVYSFCGYYVDLYQHTVHISFVEYYSYSLLSGFS